MTLDKILQDYNYHLPKELIALKPAMPRDSARLLVYSQSRKTIAENTFANLAKYLPKNSVLVFNQTKVWPARLTITKPTGGKSLVKIIIDHNKISFMGMSQFVVEKRFRSEPSSSRMSPSQGRT